MSEDRQRPRYHFLPPARWMNDPNGLIQWQGRYHLFYQCNPYGAEGPGQARMHWGHAASDDLVHWEDLPIALAPTPGGPDEDGCWSGCAVDDGGVPTIVYSGHREGKQHTCLARSRDGLLTWEKDGRNPVIPAWPGTLDLAACRDPAVWREGEDWYQLLGAGLRDGRGAALLYRSRDLVDWEYLQPILMGERDERGPYPVGTMWECPGFFRLGEQHLFFMAPKDSRQLHRPVYFLGDYVDYSFSPQQSGLLDHGNSFYAPQAMTDERGRRLLWGWLREGRGVEAQRAAGWAGVMSLPRELTLLPDGTLGIAPVAELAALRGAHEEQQEIEVGAAGPNRGRYRLQGPTVTSGAGPHPPAPLSHCGEERGGTTSKMGARRDARASDETLWDHTSPSQVAGREIEMRGRALEIGAVWEPGGAEAFGIDVACSRDGREVTRIRYEPVSRRLVVDRRNSSLSDEGQRDELGETIALGDDEPLRLQVFVDHSVVEIFANGRAAHAMRIYPTLEGDGVRLFAEGGTARVRRLDVWQLASIWDGRQAPALGGQKG